MKKAKSRFHSRSYDDVINKALDFSEGKEIRKLQEKINKLTDDNIGLTAVNLERREENKKIIEERKPLEDKIESLNEEMEKKDGELKAKGEDLVSLQTDNEQLKREMEEHSHDKVFEENQYLKRQIGEKDMDIEDRNKRIDEVEKLIKIASSEKEEIISSVFKLLRDFKQYLPASLEPYDISIYIKNIQKSIEQFEGYLNTCKNHAS